MAGRADLLRKPRVAIARRDLNALTREKTIVLALLIQLFVASFSSFLVVGLTSLYDPGSVSADEIVVGISGDQQDTLQRVASRRDGLRSTSFATRSEAIEAFQNGRVDAVVHATDLNGRVNAEVIAPQSSLRTTVIVQEVRQLLEAAERNERALREEYLSTEIVPLPQKVPASPYFGFTYTVLIPLLMFLPPFISGSVAIDSITEDIERETLELLRVAPVSLVDIVDGKAAGMILLAPAQALLWILLMGLNGISVSNVLPLLVLVTAVTTVVVTVGLLLGLQTGRRRQAQLLYSVLVLFGFGLAVVLPEHPTTTVAKLAVDSPSTTTFALVGGYVLLAVVVAVGGRRLVARQNPEDL